MATPTHDAPRGRHPSRQQAFGAPAVQQAGWDGSSPDTRGQPDDYYDGRQRGGISEGSFAHGGYGRGYGTGYSGNYGGYGFEPRLTPARPGPLEREDTRPPQRPTGLAGESSFEPDYQRWRGEQLRSFDDDYQAYRQQQRKSFSEEFSAWRDSRRVQATGTRTGSGGTQSPSAGQTPSGDPSGSAAGLGSISIGTTDG